LKFISSLYFSKQAVYFQHPVNSSTNQDFHFPGLSRTLSFDFQNLAGPLIFQDFPGPGKSLGKIQDFAGGVGTLHMAYW